MMIDVQDFFKIFGEADALLCGIWALGCIFNGAWLSRSIISEVAEYDDGTPIPGLWEWLMPQTGGCCSDIVKDLMPDVGWP